MLQSEPVKTLRLTWDELMRRPDEIAPDDVLEVRIFKPKAPPTVDAENQALIHLLDSWREEDATDDPAELERRDAENSELLRNLHASRKESRP